MSQSFTAELIALGIRVVEAVHGVRAIQMPISDVPRVQQILLDELEARPWRFAIRSADAWRHAGRGSRRVGGIDGALKARWRMYSRQCSDRYGNALADGTALWMSQSITG